MASTVTYEGAPNSGLLITITETSIGASTESGPFIVPKRGVIKSFRSYLVTPGSSSVIDPELGRAAAWTSGDLDEILAEPVAGPSASINAGDTNVHYSSTSGEMYLRSQPDNAATDASITTEILIFKDA